MKSKIQVEKIWFQIMRKMVQFTKRHCITYIQKTFRKSLHCTTKSLKRLELCIFQPSHFKAIFFLILHIKADMVDY